MNQFGVLALGSRFKRLSDTLFSEVESLYEELDIPISPTSFPLLRLLQSKGKLTVVEIAEALGISHPAISKQVNKLLIDELVIKTSDQADNRRSFITLSEKTKTILDDAEPALLAIKGVLERDAFNIDSCLLSSFSQYEKKILSVSLKKETLLAMKNNTKTFDICTWDERYAADFKRLNMNWLEQCFPHEIQGKDRALLSHPQSEILAKGGYIWFALSITRKADSDAAGVNVVGTCALIPQSSLKEENSYEIIKLAVDPRHKKQGVGMRLMLACIEQARAKNASRITLETNRALKPALALYQRLGFTEKKPTQGYSVARADVYMELLLPQDVY